MWPFLLTYSRGELRIYSQKAILMLTTYQTVKRVELPGSSFAVEPDLDMRTVAICPFLSQ